MNRRGLYSTRRRAAEEFSERAGITAPSCRGHTFRGLNCLERTVHGKREVPVVKLLFSIKEKFTPGKSLKSYTWYIWY
ncbi:tryptorubin family RiPP precursor [Embleya sp. NPDC020886]|uniref:tryptorubin family RiPP precursor n=1 Tax=Embleya sp. NPDC020886 TaxID=3363980 RepID=UPI0037A23224